MALHGNVERTRRWLPQVLIILSAMTLSSLLTTLFYQWGYAPQTVPSASPSVSPIRKKVPDEAAGSLLGGHTKSLGARSVRLPEVGASGGSATQFMGSLGNCTLVNVEYVPSMVESEWTKHVREWEPEFCTYVKKSRNLIAAWLAAEEDMMKGHELVGKDPTLLKVFSKFVYRHKCPDGEQRVSEAWIEPLFGFLRHPLAMCAAEWSGLSDDSFILSRDYLLLSSSQAPSMQAKHTNWYLDLGASTYLEGIGGLSQSWFVDTYRQRGIEFDRIMMWEAQPIYGPKIMRDVPKELHKVYQYFNIPVSVDDPDDPSNPLNIIKALVKPEDFLALKIDIDTPRIENALMDQILRDPEIQIRIDELFYEHHVNFKPMWGHWKTSTLDVYLDDSYEIFSRLRKMGIRMHGWP